MKFTITTLFYCLILTYTFGQKVSALKDGDIYKFAVKETGVHRLDFAN